MNFLSASCWPPTSLLLKLRPFTDPNEALESATTYKRKMFFSSFSLTPSNWPSAARSRHSASLESFGFAVHHGWIPFRRQLVDKADHLLFRSVKVERGHTTRRGNDLRCTQAEYPLTYTGMISHVTQDDFNFIGLWFYISVVNISNECGHNFNKILTNLTIPIN